MKKVLLTTVFIASLGIIVSSCKCEEKKDSELEKTEVIENKEIAVVIYQCPMKCEEAKTYEAPGQCPVCKMDLKEVEDNIEKESEQHKEDDHDHDNH